MIANVVGTIIADVLFVTGRMIVESIGGWSNEGLKRFNQLFKTEVLNHREPWVVRVEKRHSENQNVEDKEEH